MAGTGQLLVGGGKHELALFFGVLCTVLPIWLRFEAMATGPALLVYNIMRDERRRVAALLLAAP